MDREFLTEKDTAKGHVPVLENRGLWKLFFTFEIKFTTQPDSCYLYLII